MNIEEYARELGFDHVALISVDDVVTSEELTVSCNPQECDKYGTCWTCPPACGTFAEILPHITSKAGGVLVQTMRDNIDYFEDWEVLAETRSLHNDRLDRLAAAMRQEYKGVTEFSTGGCGLCDPCTYPDAPCIRPDEQRMSLSAHGVAVGATCQRAGMDYAFQNGCVRFIGMILHE